MVSVPVKNANFLAGELEINSLKKKVEFSAAAADHDIGVVPAGSTVIAAAISIPTTITATTAVKIGVGTGSAGDPDAYLLSAALTAAELKSAVAWGAGLAADTTVKVSACDTNGAAAGTIGAAGQFVLVTVTYAEPKGIYDT